MSSIPASLMKKALGQPRIAKQPSRAMNPISRNEKSPRQKAGGSFEGGHVLISDQELDISTGQERIHRR